MTRGPPARPRSDAPAGTGLALLRRHDLECGSRPRRGRGISMANEASERDEELEVPGSDCGAGVYMSGSRAYGIGDWGALCWSCAIRRGGQYDADEERWTTAPSTDDLRRP